MSQLDVLNYILINGASTMKEISIRLGVTDSTIVQNVKKLEKRGYVKRLLLEGLYYIGITAKGRSFLNP